jgi:hypothetical protein
LLEGIVFAVRFTEAPKLKMLDGYLTVNLGPRHFHFCIHEHTGNRSPDLASKRRAARLALIETPGGRSTAGVAGEFAGGTVSANR